MGRTPKHVLAVSLALRNANFAARPGKCEFGFSELCFLGQFVGNGAIKPMLSKVQAIQDFPVPNIKKNVRSC